jgi:outer membrane protein OmpA-like peptidoglycan-associated protein
MRTLRPFALHIAAIAMTCLLITTAPPAHAQSTLLSIVLPDRIRISERSNLSRSEDGRYVGLTNSQVTGYLTRSGSPYHGQMLVFEQTLRDMSRVGRAVDAAYFESLEIHPQRAFVDSTSVPRYRNIPTLPTTPIQVGATWSAPGELIVTLPYGALPLVLDVEVTYSYAGTEIFGGELVHRLEGQFGARYPPRVDPDADVAESPPVRTDITRISGRHTLTILLPANSAAPLFIRDELEEQYELVDQPATLFRGHRLLFVYGLSTRAQQEIADVVELRLEETGTENVVIESTDTGTRLTIQEIRFVPDQAVILTDERGRLDQIASVLQLIPDVRFLVVGHTADVGTQESQIDLSWQRAQVVVAELVRRGLDQLRFDIDGRGGGEPVAPNESESGRAMNRRVEIYILEE